MANSAYGCTSFISSLFSVCVCANALPQRKHIRQTDVHKKTFLSFRFLFWLSLLLGGLGFQCLSQPPAPRHLLNFLFKNGKVFLFYEPKRRFRKRNRIRLCLPSLPGELKWVDARGLGCLNHWLQGSCSRGKTFSVAPPRRGQGSDNKQFNFSKPRGAFSCGASLVFLQTRQPLAANSSVRAFPWYYMPVQ